MPDILHQNLRIDPRGDSARVTIALDVVWEPHEQRAGQEYLLRVEMWGEDGTFLDPDNRLFSFGFPFLTDGTEVQSLSFLTLVRLRDIDEDSGEDEVYARLSITPVRSFGTASARTNTVRGRF